MNEADLSWQKLMELLDEAYPPELFSTADTTGKDPGPRIISLLREIHRLRKSGTSPDSTPAGMRQVHVSFAEKPYTVLVDLARQRNTTISDVLSHAIGLERYIREVHEQGGRILVERGDNVGVLVIR